MAEDIGNFGKVFESCQMKVLRTAWRIRQIKCTFYNRNAGIVQNKRIFLSKEMFLLWKCFLESIHVLSACTEEDNVW